VSADAVEAQVWRVIEQLLINEATVERLIAQRQARVEPERDRLQYSLEAVAQAAIAPTAPIQERRAIIEALDVVVVCRYRETPLQTRTFFSVDLDPDNPGAHTRQGETSLRQIDWTRMVPKGQPTIPLDEWPIIKRLRREPDALKALETEVLAKVDRSRHLSGTISECMSGDNSPEGLQRWHSLVSH
jgi:hypothetical protein